MELFTSAEAAAYLRIKERKLYELVAEGAIPCTKVTGRWLFPRNEVDRWILGTLTRPDGMAATEPRPIVGGSHDPLLEWALRESGCALASLPEGSERGLERFAAGEIVAAAIHLHDLDRDETDANVEALHDVKFHDSVLIAFARREEGLLVAPGNPLGLRSLADVLQRRAKLALRPKGAGAQLLLLGFLHRGNIPLSAFVTGPMCPTGPDIAQAIRGGRADCGVATRSVANTTGLDFISLAWEHFDLAMRQRDYFRTPLQGLFRFLRTRELASRAGELGGYDVSAAGTVRFAP